MKRGAHLGMIHNDRGLLDEIGGHERSWRRQALVGGQKSCIGSRSRNMNRTRAESRRSTGDSRAFPNGCTRCRVHEVRAIACWVQLLNPARRQHASSSSSSKRGRGRGRRGNSGAESRRSTGDSRAFPNGCTRCRVHEVRAIACWVQLLNPARRQHAISNTTGGRLRCIRIRRRRVVGAGRC
jgi:hypothetical protein